MQKQKGNVKKSIILILKEVKDRVGGVSNAINNSDLKGLRQWSVDWNNFKEDFKVLKTTYDSSKKLSYELSDLNNLEDISELLNSIVPNLLRQTKFDSTTSKGQFGASNEEIPDSQFNDPITGKSYDSSTEYYLDSSSITSDLDAIYYEDSEGDPDEYGEE